MEKEKLDFSGMLFEVTRRCNLKCEHCLRGDAQDLDMSKEVIDATLDNVRSFEVVKLTGGEPFLVPEVIEYLVDEIIKREILISTGFTTIVNGTIFDERAIRSIKAFNKLAKYIKEISIPKIAKSLEIITGKKPNIKNIETAQIIVSDDHFHKNDVKKALDFYKKYASEYVEVLEMKELDKVKESDIFDLDDTWVREGRAIKNNIGLSCSRCKNCHMGNHRSNIEDGIIKCEISITAKGDVVYDPSLSFESQDEINMGNVLDKSIVDILIDNEWNEPLTCGEISDMFKIVALVNAIENGGINRFNLPKEKIPEAYEYYKQLIDAMLFKRDVLKELHNQKPYLTYEEAVDALDADFAINSDGNFPKLMRRYYGNYELKYPEDWVYNEREQQAICDKYKWINTMRSFGIDVPSPLKYKIKSCDATLVYEED